MTDRYARQILVEQLGETGQQKLEKSSVIVVGAGGLGSPALTYLAAAGVGHLGLIDMDTVAASNLNRQFLHGERDVGRSKADSALDTLKAQNSEIEIRAFDERLTVENASTLLAGYDIILGAVDSFETRFAINQACVTLGTPYIDGGVNGFSGSVLYSHPPDLPCLNCIFPTGSSNKRNTGVLGTTAGTIGVTMANLALLTLLGLPNPLRGKLFLYDGLRMRADLIDIQRNEACPVCGIG